MRRPLNAGPAKPAEYKVPELSARDASTNAILCTGSSSVVMHPDGEPIALHSTAVPLPLIAYPIPRHRRCRAVRCERTGDSKTPRVAHTSSLNRAGIGCAHRMIRQIQQVDGHPWTIRSSASATSESSPSMPRLYRNRQPENASVR
jgi:hypothetical protein